MAEDHTNGKVDDETKVNEVSEKSQQAGNNVQTRAERVHVFHESEGYIVDIRAGDAADTSGLKLAKDGHTVLIPQPSDDKKDPLNWTWAKKHLILFVVSIASFLPDYGSATGAVVLIPQAA